MNEMDIIQGMFRVGNVEKPDQWSDEILKKTDPLTCILFLIIEQDDLYGNLVKVREILINHWDTLSHDQLSLLWRLMENSKVENDPMIKKKIGITKKFIIRKMEQVTKIFQLIIINREKEVEKERKIATIMEYIHDTHQNSLFIFEYVMDLFMKMQGKDE